MAVEETSRRLWETTMTSFQGMTFLQRDVRIEPQQAHEFCGERAALAVDRRATVGTKVWMAPRRSAHRSN